MKFLYPNWLYLLLLLPLGYGLLLLDEKRRKTQFSSFIPPALWPRIVPDLKLRHRERKGIFFLAGIGFLLLALARPQFGSHEEGITTTGLDLMVVLDVSSSMEVEDVVPSRLKKAKHLVKSVLDRLGGDRVGLVAFAEGATLACPLTTDLEYLWETAQVLDPRSIQSQGTDVGIGLDTALRSLERGAEGQLNANGTSSAAAAEVPATHVVLLVSDGEDHEGQALEVARKLKENGIRLYVLGVGTEKGGPIPIKDELGNSSGFKRDRKGQAIVSTFHADFLNQVAQAAGGRYWTLTESESEIQELLEELGTLDRQSMQERRYTVYEERFQIPLFMALIFFFLELTVPARKLAQRSKAAQAIPITLLVALTFLLPQPGYSEVQGPTALDVYLQNQKGLDAFRSGQIDEARKSFGAAQARDPSRPELEYNQGVVEMENGDPERAAQAFLKSAQATQDPRLKSKSYYNLGQALTKKGDSKAAIQGYVSAIDAARRAKDLELEEKSRKNLQLLIQEQKKQKQQSDDKNKDKNKPDQNKADENKSDQNKPDKGQPDKNQPDKNQDSQKDLNDQKKKEEEKGQQEKQKQGQKDNSQEKEGEPKKQDGGKDSPENSSKDPRDSGQPENPDRNSKKNAKPNFNSSKMTAEDANRVMKELSNREKILQEKLQKGRVKTQNNPKDW